MAGRQEGLIRKSSWQQAATCAVLLPLLALAGCNTLVSAALKPDVQVAAFSVPPGDYVLDPAHASILFKIDHLGFSNYVGRFNIFDASLTGDPEHPEAATVIASVDMTSLDIANSEFAAELMGPDWFDAAAHPQATFRTYGLKIVGENETYISGDLTLKGKTQAVIIRARLNGSAFDRLRGADVVGFSATLELKRSDFGIDKYSGLITDEVIIEIEAEFVRQAPG